MTKQNEKTVLEHLLDNNKKMILASRYQNTIYNGKTLCEYFGVESKTKKESATFSRNNSGSICGAIILSDNIFSVLFIW